MYSNGAFNVSPSASAREVVECLMPNISLPDDISEQNLYRIIRQILCHERPKRTKLSEFNTFHDAVDLFRRCKNILVLTGAGVSVSCGIPDFRSRDGIYDRLHLEYPDLPDPTAMFDIAYFTDNPKPFFEFARELFPGRYAPSICHYFIKLLETENKLLRNYTQNIDTLEQVAEITRIVQCHGSFAKATCRKCGIKVDCESIREDINEGRIAMCKICNDPKAVLKPDIVFFGEDLADEFHERMAEDRHKVDLVVVIGSSLKVQPVALLPYNVGPDIPQILINRESLPHYTADIELLGDCDDIVTQIVLALGPPYVTLLDGMLLKNEEHKSINDERQDHPVEIRHALSDSFFKQLLEQPEVKRARLVHEYSPFLEERYVNVGARLPANGFLFIPPNQNIFPGAEMYFDQEDNVFCQLTSSYRSSRPSSSSSLAESGRQRSRRCLARFRTLSLEQVTPRRRWRSYSLPTHFSERAVKNGRDMLETFKLRTREGLLPSTDYPKHDI